jgi:PhnB protein
MSDEQAVREGFGTVTPYLMVHAVDPVVSFLEEAFGATETHRTTGGGGGTHVEVRIGDSMLMMGGDRPDGGDGVPTSLFVYVEDCDEVYESALAAGAESMMEPGPNFDEPRGAAVVDPFGNQWFIATHDQ